MAAKLESMERHDDDKLDSVAMFPMVSPDFPPHLRIALTHKEFKKLDCDPKVAERGDVVEGRFKGRITDVHFPEDPDDEKCRIEIQIEELGLECESEDEENEEQEKEED